MSCWCGRAMLVENPKKKKSWKNGERNDEKTEARWQLVATNSIISIMIVLRTFPSHFHPFLLNLCSEPHGNSSVYNWEQKRTKRRIGITQNFEQQRNYFMMAMGWIGMRHIIHWTRNIKFHHAEIMGSSQNGPVFLFVHSLRFSFYFLSLPSFSFV